MREEELLYPVRGIRIVSMSIASDHKRDFYLHESTLRDLSRGVSLDKELVQQSDGYKDGANKPSIRMR